MDAMDGAAWVASEVLGQSMQQEAKFKPRPANDFKIREMGSQFKTGVLDFRKERNQSASKYFYDKNMLYTKRDKLLYLVSYIFGKFVISFPNNTIIASVLL